MTGTNGGGREIDAMVAEKVMGLKSRFIPDTNWAVFQVDGWTERLVLDYSTNITDAFQVVEKMRERGYYFALIQHVGGTWGCEFTDKGYELKGKVEDEKTAPEAICRAALAACKEKP